MKNISAPSYLGTSIDTVNSCPSTKWRSIGFFAESVDTGKQADGSRIMDKKSEWPDRTLRSRRRCCGSTEQCTVYTESCSARDMTQKNTARKRNWGDRNWLCKVKFQFRVHFRQKGGGGAPRETSSGARVKLADARERSYVQHCVHQLYIHIFQHICDYAAS